MVSGVSGIWVASVRFSIVASFFSVVVFAGKRTAIRDALERAGVEFTNGDRPGVRLRK